MPASDSVISAAPGMSSGACRDERVSGTCRIEIQIVAAASGMLMRNTSRQLTASINHPPKNGPIELATPARPDQAPIATPRSSGWNVAAMIARLPGTSSAPGLRTALRRCFARSGVYVRFLTDRSSGKLWPQANAA